MANLKRRPETDLNHDNWDEEDEKEEKGEFRRANEDDLRNRRILKPRRKLTMGNAEAASSGSVNPFSSFAFGIGGRPGGTSTTTATPAFSFGLPANPLLVGGVGRGESAGPSTGSLFKIAGITPSSEPPTKASADSSTTDTPEAVGNQATNSVTGEVDFAGAEGVGSESDGIAEESSNSSSLPWNVSARQRDDSNAVDSNTNNVHRSGSMDQNNPSWLDADDLDDKEASAASSTEAMQLQSSCVRDIHTEAVADADAKRTAPATSSAPADSSESSSAHSNHHPSCHFNFGGTSFTTNTPSGSLFQPFQHNNPSSSTTIHQNQHQTSSVTSPESSGIVVRTLLEDDLASYENDTTSSNKLTSEGNDYDNDNEVCADEIDGGDPTNEEREAEGVDS